MAREGDVAGKEPASRRQRRLSLPSEVTSALALSRGERPLAWARGTQDSWHVGTAVALHIGSPRGFRRVAWEQIERADWRSEESYLVIVEVAAWGEPEVRTELELVEQGRLLELVRERVTKSVIINLYAPVRGRRGLSVVGRRSPSGDGDVAWSYVLGPGLDPDDPAVRQVAERTLTQAQAELAGL